MIPSRLLIAVLLGLFWTAHAAADNDDIDARLVETENLYREQGPEIALPEFERLDTEAKRLDALIGQILSYTKLHASPDTDSEPIEIADLIHEVVENVNYECKADGIDGVSVVAQIDASPIVQGHADAMTSAIENIARNAVHHSPPDSEVKISLSQEDENVLIDVRDSGPGVDEADLPNLFEPFFRTRASAESKNGRGTGLGLAIAARAIAVNGGTISIRNHPDGGLLVRILLPK